MWLGELPGEQSCGGSWWGRCPWSRPVPAPGRLAPLRPWDKPHLHTPQLKTVLQLALYEDSPITIPYVYISFDQYSADIHSFKFTCLFCLINHVHMLNLTILQYMKISIYLVTLPGFQHAANWCFSTWNIAPVGLSFKNITNHYVSYIYNISMETLSVFISAMAITKWCNM
jgi:hypothetical protein